MARQGYIGGADDMLLDMERVDLANAGAITPHVMTSIRAMAACGCSARDVEKKR